MKDPKSHGTESRDGSGVARKRYEKPELVWHGTLRELVAGGSASSAELCGQDDQTGCNPDENKRRP